jgi:hypothetical protein
MNIDKKAALAQFDNADKLYFQYKSKHVNHRGAGYSDEERDRDQSELQWTLMATIERLAPPGSIYRKMFPQDIHDLFGVVKSLRTAWEAGYLDTVRELIHGETFADFLDMADHLLKESYKDAAAVIAGGVLEQHLRALCVKHGVSPVPGNLNALNTALYHKAYESDWMKQITAWGDIRNNAAHGHYDKVKAEMVEPMVASIRTFISMHPARSSDVKMGCFWPLTSLGYR